MNPIDARLLETNELLETMFALAANYPEHHVCIEAPIQRLLNEIGIQLSNSSPTDRSADLARYGRNIAALSTLVARSRSAGEAERMAIWRQQQIVRRTASWQL
jgi:hypothetical protein